VTDRSARLCLLVFPLILLLYGTWLIVGAWHPSTAGFMADDGLYLLLADRFSRASGQTLLPVHQYVWEATNFPPLWPLLLGLLGASSEAPQIAYLVTAVLALASGAILALWLTRETGGDPVALCVGLCAAMTPGWVLHAQEPWSEFLFCLFVFSALQAECRRHWRLAAVLCLAAYFTRSAGIALIGAFILQLCVRRPPGALSAAAIALVPAIAWSISSDRNTESDSYIAMFARSFQDSSIHELSSHLSRGAAALFWGLASNLSFTPGLVAFAAGAAILCTALLGALARIRAGRLDGYLIVLYLGTIWLWLAYMPSHVAQRLAMPIFPLLLALGYMYVARSRRVMLRWAVLLTLIAILMPAWIQVGVRTVSALPESASRFAHSRFWLGPEHLKDAVSDVTMRAAVIHALRELNSRVPADECVVATHPQLVLLHARRISHHPTAGMSCQYRYVMRSPGYDRALGLATDTHRVIYEVFLPDQTPIAALLVSKTR